YCLPKYRPLGVGIRLMRDVMACPEPVLSIGGSEATLAMLPRLRWTRLPDVQKYVLPVNARSVAGSVLRSRWPACDVYPQAIRGFSRLGRPRRAPGRGCGVGRIAEWRPGTAAPLPMPQRHDLVELLEQVDLDWVARMPAALAQPLGLVFFLDDATVGFSL